MVLSLFVAILHVAISLARNLTKLLRNCN
ncbi:hypothetical protein LINPERPRIM_LOCUS18685 [Linum perenne]